MLQGARERSGPALLGFTPRSGGDGRYHAIRVLVRNPDWRVRARSGFLDFTSSQADEREILGSFFLPDMFRELALRLDVVPVQFRLARGRLRVWR